MFEKIGRAAEKAASGAGTSRRGFLWQLGRAALGAAVAAGGLLASPGRAPAGSFKCKCKQRYYGCAPTDYECIGYCATYGCPGK
jgi:hypothetical protein